MHITWKRGEPLDHCSWRQCCTQLIAPSPPAQNKVSFLKGMQIKTTQGSILHLLDRPKRNLTTPSIDKDTELLFAAGHCINWNIHFRKQLCFLKNKLHYCCSITFVCIFSPPLPTPNPSQTHLLRSLPPSPLGDMVLSMSLL